VTALPINALAMGLLGGFAAWGIWRSVGRVNRSAALFLAGWVSLMVPAACLAVALGVQPALAHTAEGTPLFFPFGISVTLPAILLPHALIGIGEGFLTVLIVRIARQLGPGGET
jgi:cobalt/nickel transport system permease protein